MKTYCMQLLRYKDKKWYVLDILFAKFLKTENFKYLYLYVFIWIKFFYS